MADHKDLKKIANYLEDGLQKEPYSKLRQRLIKKGWPDQVVKDAYAHVLKSSKPTGDIVDILTSPIAIKHDHKKYLDELALPKRQGRHFFERSFSESKKVDIADASQNVSGSSDPLPKEMQDTSETTNQKGVPSAFFSSSISDEEAEKMFERTYSPPPKKKQPTRSFKYEDPILSKKKEAPVIKKDTSQDVEAKLRMLEERLKNFNVEKESQQSFKNPVTPEPVEFVSEPVGDRAQTGIPGLDPIIQGGLKRDTVTLVAGGPGCGKSTFGMQYIVNGIEQFNEPGIYISFEQSKQELYAFFGEFGWDLEKYEKEGKLQIIRSTPEQMVKILEGGGGTLRDAVDSIHAKRIVIDSISDFLMLHKTELTQRKFLIDLFALLIKFKCTSIIISEQETDPLKHVSSVVEYQVDGVILIYNERIGDIRQRAIEIFKMRGTKHAGRILPMRIVKSGIVILSGNE